MRCDSASNVPTQGRSLFPLQPLFMTCFYLPSCNRLQNECLDHEPSSSVCNHTNYFRKCSLFTKINHTFHLCAQRVRQAPPNTFDHVFVGRQTPSTHTRETDIQQLSLQIPQSNCTPR